MRKYVSVLSFMFIFFMLSTNLAFASGSKNNEQTVEVKFKQTITLSDLGVSDFDDEELLQDTIVAAAITDWVYNESEKVFERFVSYEDIEVTVSGEEVTLDTNGRSRVNVDNLDKDNTVEINVKDTITGETYTQRISGESQMAVVFDLDISEMLTADYESMETLEKGGLSKASSTDPYWKNGEKGVYGDRLHCNRFNGYLGDGKYYSNNLSAGAIKNFFASDCDWALGKSTKCLADYTKNPYCAASPASKNGKCSSLIGHYTRFHKHSGHKS